MSKPVSELVQQRLVDKSVDTLKELQDLLELAILIAQDTTIDEDLVVQQLNDINDKIIGLGDNLTDVIPEQVLDKLEAKNKD